MLCSLGTCNSKELQVVKGDSPAALVALLKASSKQRDLSAASRLHAYIVRARLLGNTHVGSALINAYASCGALEKAEQVLHTLPERTLVAWTALIAGYARHGPYRRALDCVEAMERMDGFSPDSVTLVCVLKACGSLRDLERGQKFHADIIRDGTFGGHIFVGNALVDMYAKCGALGNAREVFDELCLRDVSSWNVMISAYAQYEHAYHSGDDEAALNCFYRMQSEGFAADLITFVGILKACGGSRRIQQGQEIHARFVVDRLMEKHISAGNALVDMYAKCGMISEAQRIFDGLSVRDLISWNVLIGAYVQQGYGKEAIRIFERMQWEGYTPDAITFISALKACGIVGAVDKGQEMQAEIMKQGWINKHALVGNALADMFSKSGAIQKAQEVFDELPSRNVASWNTLISGYLQHDNAERALHCFEEMRSAGFSPDIVTFVCILKVCAKVGAMEKGQWVHAEIVSEGLFPHILVGRELVDMYAKCGSITEAQEVFDELALQDVVSWNSLLAGYAQLGKDSSVFELFNKMTMHGIYPDFITFLIVLYACNHLGLLLNGQVYFNTMSRDYGIIPTLQHYNCMIDLFARAGHFDRVMVIIEQMPFSANLIVWHAVLSGCQKRDNEKLGRLAFEHALQIDGMDRAAYLILSNIYICSKLCVQEDAENSDANYQREGG